MQRSTVSRTGVTRSGPSERIPGIENYQSPLSEPGHPVRIRGRLPREGALASPSRESGEMGNLTTWGPPEKRGTARLHLSVSAGLGRNQTHRNQREPGRSRVELVPSERWLTHEDDLPALSVGAGAMEGRLHFQS